VNIVKKIRFLTNSDSRKKMFILVLLSIVYALIETIGISAIMPFISIASNPSLIETNEYLKIVNTMFDFKTSNDFVFTFGIVLILFYIFRGVYSIFYNYLISKFTYSNYEIFSIKLLKNYLGMNYRNFIDKNSGTLMKNITIEANNITQFLYQFLLLFTEVFTIVLLYGMLLYIDIKMTFVLTLILALKILFLTKTVSKSIKKLGVKKTIYQDNFYKVLTKTLSNFKFIKLKGNSGIILDEFHQEVNKYAKTNIKQGVLQGIPKSFLETFGFIILVSIVLYTIFKDNDVTNVIPIISIYALALYRILPALNRIIGSYNSMLFLMKSFDIVYEDLIYPVDEEYEEKISFDKSIVLQNIKFSYTSSKKILKDISLEIKKGDKVAFIGSSGEGKSTLIDLIIGIYKPISGNIFIDNTKLTDDNIKNFRKKIGYIPQSIYLFDGTVAQNIAFSDDVDENKVNQILDKVDLLNFFNEKNDGINTVVGEGGVKLSGGQKQRIAIARALYNDPEIMVLDEATSALDTVTEQKIMSEIYGIAGDKTLIIIAHRLSTIEKCDKVFTIKNGKIDHYEEKFKKI